MLTQPLPDLLIQNATDLSGQRLDVAIRDGLIYAIGPQLPKEAAQRIDAAGAALIPGLRDHHIHLCAAAVAQRSVWCGAPVISSREGLQAALCAASSDAEGWVRGLAYDASIAGELGRDELDALRADVPMRIQHAGGRLWVFNSAAIERLGEGPWERVNGRITGRLYEADAWLRTRLDGAFPDLRELSMQLARYGIVGVTDTSPSNHAMTALQLRRAVREGALVQQVLMMGDASLDEGYVDQHSNVWIDQLRIGAHKIHLLESQLPEFETLCEQLRRSHGCGRPVAFHCVTRVELVFAIAALRAAGTVSGDRIEHAGICPDELLDDLRELAVCVVTQPIFVHDRGDRYLREVAAEDQPYLYRLRALLDHGIGLAGSSDAPYGDLNPWLGMAAAMNRSTRLGKVLGRPEGLNAKQALRLYTGPLTAPANAAITLKVGGTADLCLLQQSWHEVAESLASVEVALTLRSGQIIWQS